MTLLTIFTAAWLILSLVAAAAAPGLLWGLAGWRALSFTWAATLAAVILVFALVRQRAAKKEAGAGGEGTPDAAGTARNGAATGATAAGAAGPGAAASPAMPSPIERAVPWIAAAAFILIAWLLRARHDLVGEAGAVPGAIASGVLLTKAAPLATLAHALLYRFMNGVFLRTAADAGVVLSIASGLLYTFLAFRLAARVPGDAAGKAVLFASGWAALFFGVPGVGAVSMAASLLFLVLAVDTFHGGHPAPAGLALVLAIGMHTSLACLIPAYLWLLARRTGTGRRHEANVAAMVTMSALVVLLVAIALLDGGGGPLGVALSGLGALTRTSIEATVRDGLNALLAGGPVTILSLVLLVAGIVGGRGLSPLAHGDGEPAATSSTGNAPPEGLRRFVFWLVVPATVAVLLAAPRVQGGLRWEIAAATAPVFAVAVLLLLGARLPRGRALRSACLVIGVLGGFHLVPFLAAGVSEPLAEVRLRTLPLAPGRAATILGYRSLARGRWQESSERLGEAVEADSLNLVARWGLAEAAIEREDYLDAISALEPAARIDPDNLGIRERLAETYVSQGWFEEAAREFEFLTIERPLDPRFWLRLGFARNRAGDHEGAAIAYDRALQLDPADDAGRNGKVSAWINAGSRAQEEGKVETARDYYLRAINGNPRFWQAWANLAVLYADAGRMEKALETLKSGVEHNENVSEIHLRYGLALEEAGRIEEALEQIYRARQLAPMRPGFDELISRIEKRLKDRRK